MRILLAGETFVASQMVSAGRDIVQSTAYADGAEAFTAALEAGGIHVDRIASERCHADFPRSPEALAPYAAVVLSDIGALSLLVTPLTRVGRTDINRLAMLRNWVHAGGGLMMAGGYMSFQGMDGTARYHGTPLEQCLPVRCLPHADGLEIPEGLQPFISGAHPALGGLSGTLPPVLGLNRLEPLDDPSCAVLVAGTYLDRTYPILAVRHYGTGRTAAWATDIGPHWMSQAFMESPAYAALIGGIVRWVGGGGSA